MKSHDDDNWQHLQQQLRNCGRLADDDLDWIDAQHDYTRGQARKQMHAPRGFRAELRAKPLTHGARRR